MTLPSRRAILVLIGFILLLPVLALTHELLVIAAAAAVAALAHGDWAFPFIRQIVDSPVHARILLETLGGIQPLGITVAGLPGKLLHAVASPLFLDPDAVRSSAWISALIDRDSTVLGLIVTQALVEFALIFAGALLLQGGLRRRSPRTVLLTAPPRDVLLVLVCLAVIAQAIKAVFQLTLAPGQAGLRDTGIGVGFSLVFQMNAQQYNWLMSQGLPLLIPVFLTASALGSAWLAGKIIRRLRVYFSPASAAPKQSWRWRMERKAKIAAALVPFLCLAAVLPHDYGMAKTALVAPAPRMAAAQPLPAPNTPMPLPTPTATFLPTPTDVPSAPSTMPTAATILPMPSPSVAPTPSLTPTPSPTPFERSIVELRRDDTRFRLFVNDRPVYLSGLNYNVNHTGQPDELKRRLHGRDFKIMREAGVNAVIGWGVYDQATLDVAREYNIGVIMPFELDPAGAYENKNYREEIKTRFRQYVLTYKDAPAVWGWNPGGDELLHRMETELHRTPDKLQRASDFLLELAALAYALDPQHISIVKEARDVYVPYVEDSVGRARLQKPSVDPSRYFVFAVNMYGSPEGVASVLRTTRSSIEERVGVALAAGEFAPFGLARSERPAHYVAMWQSVRENCSLGGFAYVYGPDQPNPLAPNPYDPLRLLVSEFSLVDIQGTPVDPSLAALAAEWKALGNGDE